MISLVTVLKTHEPRYVVYLLLVFLFVFYKEKTPMQIVNCFLKNTS